MLCDPNFSSGVYVRRQQRSSEDSTVGTDDSKNNDLSSYMLTSAAALSFGKPFTPMSSARTSFDSVLDDISRRHRAFAQAQQEAQSLEEPSTAAQSLSFRYPAFSVETKLDGERMIVHLSKDGIVKICSRVGNWYRYVVYETKREFDISSSESIDTNGEFI